MFKLITHVLVFAIGAGAGVYWGVNHPSQAQQVEMREQARIDQAKQVLTNVTKPPATP
jgi:CHASE3 domain sensor protein